MSCVGCLSCVHCVARGCRCSCYAVLMFWLRFFFAYIYIIGCLVVRVSSCCYCYDRVVLFVFDLCYCGVLPLCVLCVIVSGVLLLFLVVRVCLCVICIIVCVRFPVHIVFYCVSCMYGFTYLSGV